MRIMHGCLCLYVHKLKIFFACCTLLVGATAFGATAYQTRVIALTGMQGPGLPDGVDFRDFELPMISEAGHVAFAAELTGGFSGRNGTGTIWLERDSRLTMAAAINTQAPGAVEGTLFDRLGDPVVNAAGEIAFRSTMSGPDVDSLNSIGVWSDATGVLSLVSRSGEVPPGAQNGAYLTEHSEPQMNSSGDIVFSSGLGGSGTPNDRNSGIWIARSGALSPVVLEGDPAPGVPDGIRILTPSDARLADRGRVAFASRLVGDGIDSTNDEAVWLEDRGSLTLLARAGDPTPRVPFFETFSQFSPPSTNSQGVVSFLATLQGPSVSSRSDEGIWSTASGELDLVVREDTPAPGTQGRRFANPGFSLVDNHGRVAFFSELRGSGITVENKGGIWLGVRDELTLIARDGDFVPGLLRRERLVGLANFSINADGQIAFIAGILDPATGFADDRGIWATDRSGELHLVVREGDQIEVSPGDVRTVSGLGMLSQSSNVVGRSPIDRQGQIVFGVGFTDGTAGIVVSRVVAVPEPSSMATFILASLVAWRLAPLGCRQN